MPLPVGMTFDLEIEEFTPTFTGSRQERRWIRSSLAGFWEDHLIPDVPRRIAVSANAILMEFIGDEEFPAPILHSITLEPDEARPLFARLLRNVETTLADFRIHADLSAYNVLYWMGEVRIIDFPQVVDAIRHPNPFPILLRDVTRLCDYFRRQGLQNDPAAIAHDLWKEWVE